MKRKSSFSTNRKFKRSRKWQYKKRRLGLRRSRFNCHRYKRYGTTENIDFDADGTNQFFGGAVSFSLGDVINNTELINLYDQYKIDTVVVKVQMLNIPESYHNAPGSGTGTESSTVNKTQLYPKFWYYRDHDDATAITSKTTFQEIGKAKCFVMEPNKVYSFKVKPSTLRDLGTGAAEVCYPKKLDCNYASVAHYGFKYGLDTMGTYTSASGFWKLNIEKLYYLKMFNSR